ncbi:MAG TPA: hypothetical protein VFV50_07440 [Bdellovibrionales bacterium]|nr:hypothetical protein [Bdellovibrionales bacterium]
MTSRLVIAASIVVSCFFAPRAAQAEPGREFIMSATYGVLAGTLVGAATLAFTDKPGDNLRNIARGASYGLYAGILLGLYVVYGVPGEDDPEAPPPPENPYDGPVPEERLEDPEARRAPHIPAPRLEVPELVPLISERGIEGAGVAIRYLF